MNSKIYYTIDEACRMTDLTRHVLRYWEKEFTQLRPKKGSGGNRAYRTRDIELILYIKRLLYEEKYTVREAKLRISEERREARLAKLGGGRKPAAQKAKPEAQTPQLDGPLPEPKPGWDSELISAIRGELEDILDILEKKP